MQSFRKASMLRRSRCTQKRSNLTIKIMFFTVIDQQPMPNWTSMMKHSRMLRYVFLSSLNLPKYIFVLKSSSACSCSQGYSRKGAALSFLKRYDDAIATYQKGLKIDPTNRQILTDLELAKNNAAKLTSQLFHVRTYCTG